mmetsp:Transcript_17564/g.41385  ORF Transcript_17564/g.41385 Transcript_17564/m.41385 type:complete len:204 (+) Transcript_17564:124-735(+)
MHLVPSSVKIARVPQLIRPLSDRTRVIRALIVSRGRVTLLIRLFLRGETLLGFIHKLLWLPVGTEYVADVRVSVTVGVRVLDGSLSSLWARGVFLRRGQILFTGTLVSPPSFGCALLLSLSSREDTFSVPRKPTTLLRFLLHHQLVLLTGSDVFHASIRSANRLPSLSGCTTPVHTSLCPRGADQGAKQSPLPILLRMLSPIH